MLHVPFICIGLNCQHERKGMLKTYIPLQGKTIRVGLDTHCHNFTLGIPTCWYLKTLKFALPPTPTLNASRWNIGGVGSQCKGLALGMYISCCLCIIFRIGYVKILANANADSSGIQAYILPCLVFYEDISYD